MINYDPLRFLKPRKKQFHLTPTKKLMKQFQKSPIVKANSQLQTLLLHNQMANQSSKSQIYEQKSRNNDFMKTGLVHQNNQTGKFYNPLNYFCHEVQQFLKGKKGLTNKQKNKQTFKVQNLISNGKALTQQYIIPLRNNEDFNEELTQNTVRLEDYFQQAEQHPSNFAKIITKNNQSQIKQIEQMKRNVNQMNKKVELILTSNVKNDEFAENNKEILQKTELRPCGVCGRKFNPNSYEKHVNICEKVFFNKRKQFSSQKQRSKSKDKQK